MNEAKQTDLVTVAEVARALSVSEQTVRNLDKRGILPAMRLSNGTRVFSREAVASLKARLERV